MLWASSSADDAKLDRALDRACGAVLAELGGNAPDLVVVFASAHHASGYDRIPSELATRMGGLVLGCSAGGVIGGGREIEERPGLSISAAALPGVRIHPFHLAMESLPAPTDVDAWRQLVGVAPESAPHFVILPEPFTFDAEALVRGLDASFPESRKVGGVASGARAPGGNALFLGSAVHRSGAVGVALTGDVEIDTVVAQGCRPIGEPMFVTAADRNVIRQIDGRPPLAVLQELHGRLGARDQDLFRHSLFLGIAMNGDRQEYRQGDFLIRNLAGVDGTSGAMAFGAWIEPGSIVQFHLRDAQTSADDLEAMLAAYRSEHAGAPPYGSLLFSCLGRGMHLYGEADHDTGLFRRLIGEVPLGGFFCNGEIGPVHGTTFLHGYTSSFGIFRPRLNG